jgi:uncharacterized protein YcbX
MSGTAREVGSLEAIHRYPVKSMLGESLSRTSLGEKGMPGDRAWAVRDEVRGGIQGGKKLPGLMSCAARYLEEPGTGDAPAPEIELPSGEVLRASDPDAAKRIGEAIAHEISLWPLLPADALEHYRRVAPDNDDMVEELRAIFGREPDEPLPDLGKFPPEIFEFQSPPGSYFDLYPLLVMTRQSLETLAACAPESRIDVRRFRPNLLVSAEGGDFPELAWVGKRVQIGKAVIAVEMECPRCVMTTHGFADLPKDPNVMRKLVQNAEGNLGVYATVETPGEIRAGDPVALLE